MAHVALAVVMVLLLQSDVVNSATSQVPPNTRNFYEARQQTAS